MGYRYVEVRACKDCRNMLHDRMIWMDVCEKPEGRRLIIKNKNKIHKDCPIAIKRGNDGD